MKANRGFTLLEILVALMILALTAVAVLQQSGSSIRQLQALQARTTALWLAENQLALLLASDDVPTTGTLYQRLELDQQRWEIATEITATSDPWLNQLDIRVGLEQQPPILTLTAYRGRY